MAAAGALVMPSYFESLSMVTLEAWASVAPCSSTGAATSCGPVHPQQRGPLLRVAREFGEALWALTDNPVLNAALGRNGREHYRRHYAWPVILRKYEETLARLQQEESRRPARPRARAAAGLVGPPPPRRAAGRGGPQRGAAGPSSPPGRRRRERRSER